MNRLPLWGAMLGTLVLLLGAATLARRPTPQTTPQGALQAPPDPKPLYVITFADLAPNNAATGTELLKQYVLDTKKDLGIIRCDLVAQSNRTNHFVIVQVWQDTAVFNRHEESQHTKEFRAKMQPLLGAPFDQRLHFQVE